MFPPVAVLVAVALGALLALLGAGTFLNGLAARWATSRPSTKDHHVRKTWGAFLKSNVVAIGTALCAMAVVYVAAIVGQPLLGVRNQGGPPAPGWGGPPGWYLLLTHLTAIVTAVTTDLIVFLLMYRRRA